MIAERLKKAREEIGKGQKEMAKLAGASYRVWQSYEAGKVIPGGKIFESLSKLGFNTNWLLTGKGEMMIEKEADEMASKKAVAKVKAIDLIMNKLAHDDKLKELAFYLVINEYLRDNHLDMSEMRKLGLLAILIELTKKMPADWKTVEEISDYIRYLIKIIENLSNDFRPLRELGMNSDSAISLIRYLDNPNYMEHPEKFFDE